eukprot:983786-Pyramimonas_sp.AAC.1
MGLHRNQLEVSSREREVKQQSTAAQEIQEVGSPPSELGSTGFYLQPNIHWGLHFLISWRLYGMHGVTGTAFQMTCWL